MRTPTRTDLVEEHERKILSLRNKALDLTTTARHYASLADSISGTAPEGGQWFIDARGDCADYAKGRMEACATQARVLRAEADRLEREGLR